MITENDTLEEKIVYITDDGLISCILSPGQKLQKELNQMNEIKQIKFEIESWKNYSSIQDIQKHFYSNKSRVIDPKKYSHNLPIGVIECLKQMIIDETYIFKIFPKYQNNPSIQNYPIEDSELNYRLRITSIVKVKKLDPNDIGSYLFSSLAFKEEGNEHYKKNEFPKALDLYQRGLIVLTGLPKKLKKQHEFEKNSPLNEVKSLHIQLLNNISMVCFRMGSFEKGIAQARLCLEIDPGNEKAKYRLAKYLEAMKDFGEAMKIYKELEMKENERKIKVKICKYEESMSVKMLDALLMED